MFNLGIRILNKCNVFKVTLNNGHLILYINYQAILRYNNKIRLQISVMTHTKTIFIYMNVYIIIETIISFGFCRNFEVMCLLTFSISKLYANLTMNIQLINIIKQKIMKTIYLSTIYLISFHKLSETFPNFFLVILRK